MQHECRITVLETKVFPEYQEKYLADPKSGPCPCFRKGDTFLLKCHVTESVSKRGMEKVRPGKAGKASHIKGNSERA